MLIWYTFRLKIDDYDGLDAAQTLIASILVISGRGISGIALFYKNNNATKEKNFSVCRPEHLSIEKERINHSYPLTVCERPTGQELTHLASGRNNLDDYNGLCKEW